MVLSFDDKARQVERDTGTFLSCHSRENPGEEDPDARFYVIHRAEPRTHIPTLGTRMARGHKSSQDFRSPNPRLPRHLLTYRGAVL